MRPTRRTAFAVLVGSFLAVGCVNTDDHEQPLILGKDTQNRLVGGGEGKSTKVAAFDPSATGGKGVSMQNSFNRTSPGPGTGTSTGNFASTTMPSQVGLPPPVTPPALQGASRGEPMPDHGRTAGTHRAAAPSPPPPPVEKSPFGPPKLDPPVSDPAVRPAVAIEPAAPLGGGGQPTPTPPVAPAVIPPVMPEPEKNPLPVPVTPVAPVPPPAPGAASNEPLPMAPAPPTFVPSPTDAPIPGVQPAPKIPPAPPIRPNG